MSRVVRIEGVCLSSPYGGGSFLGQPRSVRSIGFVEARLADGRTGIGETYAGVYCPELVAPVARFLAARLETLDPAEALNRLHSPNFVPFVGASGLMRSVMSAIDIALLDLIGQQRGVPVWRLLSPRSRKSIPVYASGGSAAMSPEEVAQDVGKALRLGHTAFKMRVGFQPWKTDLLRVESARRALGGDNTLMVDAIMGTVSPPWTPRRAAARIRELARFAPAWIEEPLPPNDLLALASLRRGSKIPMAAGESWTSDTEFNGALQARAVDVIQPDATHCGGASTAAEHCKAAGRHGRRAALHVWGSPVAFLANLHVAAARPEVDYLEVPMVDLALERAMGWDVPRPSRGRLPAPQRPGLGIKLSADVKKAFPFVPGSGFIWGARAKAKR